MTMNSRCRSLFFNFTKAPVTGLPEASCTMPSMVDLFSAARANWPYRNSETAAKMTVDFDRVALDVIPDLLNFLSQCVQERPAINALAAHVYNMKASNCAFGPGYSRSIRQIRSDALTIYSQLLKGAPCDRWRVPGGTVGQRLRRPMGQRISDLEFEI